VNEETAWCSSAAPEHLRSVNNEQLCRCACARTCVCVCVCVCVICCLQGSVLSVLVGGQGNNTQHCVQSVADGEVMRWTLTWRLATTDHRRVNEWTDVDGQTDVPINEIWLLHCSSVSAQCHVRGARPVCAARCTPPACVQHTRSIFMLMSRRPHTLTHSHSHSLTRGGPAATALHCVIRYNVLQQLSVASRQISLSDSDCTPSPSVYRHSNTSDVWRHWWRAMWCPV